MWLDGRCASKDKDPPVYNELTYIFQNTTTGEFDNGSETGGERLGKCTYIFQHQKAQGRKHMPA